MLQFFFTDPLFFVLWVLALLVAITIHEFSHAFLADRLGDPTPRIQGRLTLNPIAHLDPIGTLMLLLVRFGWGKPVQFDPFNLENPRRDAAIISFAGPASNLLLATALAMLVRLAGFFQYDTSVVEGFAFPFIFLNVILAVFNLIPIHPLDGGKILIGLLPDDLASDWDRILRQYGFVILIFLILPIFGGGSILWSFLRPTVDMILNFLLPLPQVV